MFHEPMRLCLVVVICFVLLNESVSLNTRAWQTKNMADLNPGSFEYPEKQYLTEKKNVGLAFTGGGSRSYIASFGYMAALHQLNLMKEISYIGGISGGSWATMVYSYSQHDEADEDKFMCPLVKPEDETEDELKKMDPKCARSLAAASFVTIAMKSLSKSSTLGEMWCHATQDVYMTPVGIKADTRWAYNQEQINDIKQRNPELSNEEFLLPTLSTRPYPIIGSTIVGPEEGAPYTFKRENQNYTFFEMSPIYVGHVKTLDMEYNTNKKHSNTIQKRTVGGFIETYAFSTKTNSTDGSNIAPSTGLPSGEVIGNLDVPSPNKFLDIAFAAGASSFAPGAFFDSFKIQKPTSLHFNYWSPSSPIETGKKNMYDTLFADGGSYENIPLISFLQRGVDKIIYCSNSATGLQPSNKWNIDNDGAAMLPDMIDSSIPAFFGYFTENDHKFQDRSYEYEKDQIFAQSDYAAVIKGLQAAQTAGSGIIYRTTLTTVQNEWWGLAGGMKVDITFIVLGRLSKWESLLNNDMRKIVQPKKDKDINDLSQTVKHGPFKHFPNYGTQAGEINSEQANLLADMAGWSILQNAEMFQDILA
jgi:predicted acylesterase/phospholipase RssA